jgi:ring-1,2-phenylacetyl-CoA epoxidase subunit PaaD
MVTMEAPDAASRARAIASAVKDPEVPVLTIEDLGVLRDVRTDGDRVIVTITPTYSGCPAMDVIRDDLVLALSAAGFADVDVRLTLSPAWTTDWMTDAGKQKLSEYGIAPPSGASPHTPGSLTRTPGGRAAVGPIKLSLGVKCPRCGSLDTREVSRFGSTSCKALYECRACLEPFDHFKVH